MTARRWLAHAVACTLLLAPRPLRAQRGWRPEDRTVIGSMLHVYAVAADAQRLYVVTAGQVLIRDELRREWQGPFTGPQLGQVQEVRGGLVDPFDRSLWLVTGTGWLRYDPTLDLWEQGFAGASILGAGLDRNAPLDGLYLRTPSGWMLAQRGGGVLPAPATPRGVDLLRPVTVADAVQANPQLQLAASGFLLGPGLRPVRVTSAAAAADQTGWWLGTDGAGLLFLPFGAPTPEPRPWGLPGEVASAVATVPGGVWVATEREVGMGAAVTFVGDSLDRFEWRTGDRLFGQPFSAIRALHPVDSLLWIGTDQGAVALAPGGDRAEWYTERQGLPDRRVLAIAARRGRLVLGTAAGIVERTDSGMVRVAPDYIAPAYALALSGDTTWVGTPRGLFAAVPGETDLRQAPGWDRWIGLRTPVPALLWRGDTLVALTDNALLWRDPGTGQWTAGPDVSARLGRVRALADGDRGVWVAGSSGVGLVRLGEPVGVRLETGRELPGQPWDVAVDQRWLWVATTHGLVRFRREAVER